VIICPNCGTQNQPGSRFCAECGADLRTLQAESQPTPPPAPAAIPPQFELGSGPAPTGGWSSSSDFIPPPQKARRTWLWIVLGVIGTCLLLCCALSIWSATGSGQRFLNDVETRIADYQTETAE
jgi:hypothetical protein